MRVAYSILYVLLILALLYCTFLARRSDRPVRDAVAFLESALIPPILGNILIVAFSSRTVALVGCYMYYLGMDLVMYSLVNFTNIYCKGIGGGTGKQKPTVIYIALAADAVQMLLNIFTGHAFEITAVDVEGAPYYKMIPHFGQTLHRIVDYGAFICVILIFILASVKTPKISRERYTVILMTMIGAGLLLTYNIFFQFAIDRSMIGFGVFGIVIYYFALCYKPLRLMDRVLSKIVSNLSDAFYIFDPNGTCVWANEQGCRLAGVEDGRYEDATMKLLQMFGGPGDPNENITKIKVGEGSEARYYILEEKKVKDEKDQLDGSYLRIQDVTAGEHELLSRDEQIGQVKQEAYRDALTGVGNKAAYNTKVSELNAMMGYVNTVFAVVMADMNDLKKINDDYGHKSGDIYIKGCCDMISSTFADSPVYRIGGDEFVVILQDDDFVRREELFGRLKSDFENTCTRTDAEPWQRYSAALGMAESTSDDTAVETVFRRADKAMYANKMDFKSRHGSYR